MNHMKLALSVGLLSLLLAGSQLVFAATPQWHLVSFPTTAGSHGSDGFLQNGPNMGAYDAATNQFIVFGGYGYNGPTDPNGTSGTNALWVLSDANNIGGTSRWNEVIPNGAPGSPPSRYNHTVVYDEVNSRLIVFGGCGGGCLPAYNDVWVLTNANGLGGIPTWTQLSPAGAPPAPRQAPVAVYDSSSNTMTVFGGQNGGGAGGVFFDVWVLSNANGLGGTPTWTQLSPTGIHPAGGYVSSAVYDSANHVMTVFGGLNATTSPYTNGVWILTNANGQGGTPVWSNIVANGAAGSPAKRAYTSAVYDAANNLMIIFGGASHTLFNDLWVLSHANGSGGASVWTRLNQKAATPGYTPVARGGAAAGYDSANNRMIIFGGFTVEGNVQGTWVLADANGM